MFCMLTSIVRTSVLVAAMVLVAGCGTVPKKPVALETGKVGYKMIVPDGAARYTLKPGESSTQPVLAKHANPIYPPALICKSLPPVDVAAQLTVGVDGHVQRVVVSKYLGDTAHRELFNSAVRDAAMQWVFTPLQLTQWVRHRGKRSQLETVHKPFSLWYMFHFEIVNGWPMTSSKSRRP